ncbi:MAG: class I SAM-dependent methyltransferase, partial [Chlorobi bacterium]|nr:class I SAM-dependent methyltransferase [Chlorobiota bacterium]
MQERHINRNKYFDEQVYTTEKYVIPFISKVLPVNSNLSVLEIGCGEGGNLKPFLDIGCKTTGVDLSEKKIENG